MFLRYEGIQEYVDCDFSYIDRNLHLEISAIVPVRNM